MPDRCQPAEGELLRLCDELGLQYEPQDWGVVNADGSRFGEFVHFFQSRPGLTSSQRFELGELILASANEVLLAKGKLDGRLGDLVDEHGAAFEAHLEYWRSLDDSAEFPLGEWLRSSAHK